MAGGDGRAPPRSAWILIFSKRRRSATGELSSLASVVGAGGPGLACFAAFLAFFPRFPVCGRPSCVGQAEAGQRARRQGSSRAMGGGRRAARRQLLGLWAGGDGGGLGGRLQEVHRVQLRRQDVVEVPAHAGAAQPAGREGSRPQDAPRALWWGRGERDQKIWRYSSTG